MLAVIIPTLNEAEGIGSLIDHTRRAAAGAQLQFIVSDCCSVDGTLERAARAGAMVVRGARHRADAQNRGAAVAGAECLLFLHADSLLPYGFPQLIERALADRAVVGGAFDFRFATDGASGWFCRRSLDFVVLCNRIRFRWTGNYYGDQGLFVRTAVFRQLGGFPDVPLLEDLRFCHGLNRYGRTAILSPPTRTSPRRFLHHGVWRQFLADLLLISCETLGHSPWRWWQSYNHWNRHRRSPLYTPPRRG